MDRSDAPTEPPPPAPRPSAFEPRRAGDDEAIAPLLRALAGRDAISPRECDALRAVTRDERLHPAGDTLIRAHVPVENSTLLLAGMLARVRYMANGRRQIVALHLPGDYVDLHSLLLKRMDHDVVALTDVRVALSPHADLRRVSEDEPHLTRLLWLLTVIDGAMHREWISRQGHSAAVRVAALLCEVQARLSLIGLCGDSGFPFAVTQVDLGDMVGLTSVHVNRTLRKLREAGLAEVRAGAVSIPDLAKLRNFAQFDPAYLYLHREPR